MPAYRLYWLDGAGHIETFEVIIAEDDGEALGHARALRKAVKSELWDRNRLVAKIPAYPV
jgi:hypothetical protein